MGNKTERVIDRLSQVNSNNNFVPKTKDFDKQHHRKVVTIWKYICKSFLLLLVLLAFGRMPFVGSYIDGLVDYVFGFGKYLLYCWAIVVIIGWMFNTPYSRIVKTSRFIVISLVAIFSACCIVSGVVGMIDYFKNHSSIPNFNDTMIYYHHIWYDFFKSWQYKDFFNFNVTGGILAELISYIFAILSSIVLIVVALIILSICIFIIFNINYKSSKIGLKLRGWLIKKLGGSFKYDGYNELKTSKYKSKIKKAIKVDIESIALANETIPFDLLPETDINKFHDNFNYARSIQNKLVDLFKDANIDCVPSDINVYASFSEICFEAKTEADVKQIINLQSKIAKVAKLNRFNISTKGNILRVEVDNISLSKISLRTVCNLCHNTKDLTAFIGLNRKSEPQIQNFRNSGSALIVGKKGSGSATLVVLIALSACYVTSPDNLELMIINPNNESTYAGFETIQHTMGRLYGNIGPCVDRLHEIQNIVNERVGLFKVKDVKTVEQYNKTVGCKDKIKHILIVIAGVDAILKQTFQNNKIIADILTNGPRVGVYTVLHSYSVTNELMDKIVIDNVTDKYVMTLSTQEESLKLLDNYRGYQLHGNGDCLHYVDNKISNLKRIQVCNLNYSELSTNIEIIKKFFTCKQQQTS